MKFFLGLIVGSSITILLLATINEFVPYQSTGSFKRCVTGNNITLRETTGTATFIVTFKDGHVTKIECSREK